MQTSSEKLGGDTGYQVGGKDTAHKAAKYRCMGCILHDSGCSLCALRHEGRPWEWCNLAGLPAELLPEGGMEMKMEPFSLS